MRFGAMVFVVACLLAGCAHLDINKNINALKRISPGDRQEDVLEALGPPDLRRDINDQRYLIYYQTKTGTVTNGQVPPELCTPVAIENGRVAGVGDKLAQAWISEEAERQRRAKIAERERRQAEMAKAARRQAEADRQEKIAALEKEVKPIPAHKAALNLKLYRQLLALDPTNDRYQKKVALYEQRQAKQEKARQDRAMRAAAQQKRQEWEKGREIRNKKLRQYTGNGIAEMAVHDMGPGTLYVWVKNVSRQIITTHPDHFTLIDSQNNTAPCQISASLDSVLEPGSISHGKIEFNDTLFPKKLIFRNRESGRISKSFQ